MTIAEKKEAVLAKLAAIKNSQERFAYVVGCGRSMPSFDLPCRTDSFRVDGCLANLWLVSEFKDGCCHFRADSDSSIVKGIAAILCDFYSGHTPAEVIATDPSFLEQVGITQHLTPNRRNALSKVWSKMRAFAAEHSAENTKVAA